VSVVQHRAVGSAGADAGVGASAAAALAVDLVLKGSLQLVLEGHLLGDAHHLGVRVTGHVGGVAHHLDLGGVLGHSAVRQEVEQLGLIGIKLVGAGELRGQGLVAGVSVGAGHQVHLGTGALRGQGGGHPRLQAVRVHHLVHGIALLERVRGFDLSAPDAVGWVQKGHEQRGFAGGEGNGTVCSGFFYTKQVVKPRVLSNLKSHNINSKNQTFKRKRK
jgi:hypothetical protein